MSRKELPVICFAALVSRFLWSYIDSDDCITLFSFTQYDMLTPAIPVGLKIMNPCLQTEDL